MLRRRFSPAVALLSAWTLASLSAWSQESTQDRLRRDLTYLAAPESEGRGPGTKGLDRAAQYIAEQFGKAGLKPGGVEGTWYQPFTVPGQTKQKGPGTFVLKGPQGQTITLNHGADFTVQGLSAPGAFKGPLVFAGHGVFAKDIGYDDFQDVDLKGKIAVVLRKVPRWESKELPFDGKRKEEHAGLEKKFALAETKGAAAILLVNDDLEKGDALIPFQLLSGTSPRKVPVLHVKRSVFEPIFLSVFGRSLRDVERTIDAELKPQSAPLAGWSAQGEAPVERQRVPVKNVVAVLEGKGKLSGETIVVGAHYDHLGYGGRGSRSGSKGKKEIHHGADDNASGTTALLELARRFAAEKASARRRMVFIAFSAEEMGLLGSRHYCENPLFPLQDTAAMFNLDMVGRLRPHPKTKKDNLIVQGVGTGKHFDGLLAKVNGHFEITKQFEFTKQTGGTGPSDHDSFFRKKIPVLFFFTGTHPEYHKPTDTVATINFSGMEKVVDLAQKVVADLAAGPRAEFVNVSGPASPGRTKGPKLGIIPNYEEGKDGLSVGGVLEGGAAAKAGLKTGDRIVEIAGQQVRDIQTYMVIMSQQQPGRETSIGVMRDGKKLKLKIVPQ